MKDKSQIEAALERSLRKQVNVPLLDSRFDAAVWARIEAHESRAPAAAARSVAPTPAAARLLYIVNIAGLVSVSIFVCAFVPQMFAGADIRLSLPEISVATSERLVGDVCMVISAVAIAFGLLFTPWGRRLREELT